MAQHLCDSDIPGVTLDLLCQIKRHHVENYGQRNLHDNLLSHRGGALRTAITEAVAEARRGWTAPDGTPAVWKGDDALLEKAWLPIGPPALRRELAIPRCTNCVSLYVFMVLDFVVWLAVLKVVRRLGLWAVPPRRGDEESAGGWWPRTATFLDGRRGLVEQGVSAVVTQLLVTLIFKGLVRWQPYLEEPHLILTVTLTAYLAASTFGDGLIPDL